MVHARAKYDGNCEVEVAKLVVEEANLRLHSSTCSNARIGTIEVSSIQIDRPNSPIKFKLEVLEEHHHIASIEQANENVHVIPSDDIKVLVHHDKNNVGGATSNAEIEYASEEDESRNVPLFRKQSEEALSFPSEVRRSRSSSTSSSSSKSSRSSKSSDKATRKSIDFGVPGEAETDEKAGSFEEEAESDMEPSDKVSHDVAFKPRLLIQEDELLKETKNDDDQKSLQIDSDRDDENEPMSELTNITSRSFSPVPAFGGSLERRTAEISGAVEETEPETGDVEYARIRQASNATCENTFISPPLEIAVNAPTLAVEEDSFLQDSTSLEQFQAKPISVIDTSSSEIRKSPEPLNSVFKPSVTFAEPPKDSSSSGSQSSSSSEDEMIRNKPDAEENEEPLQENISVRHPFRTFASVASPPESVTVERPTSKIVEQATSIRRDSRGREIDLESMKPAARWNVRPGAELPLDAGSSEEVSVKNEDVVDGTRDLPVNKTNTLRYEPQAASSLRVDPDRVMDVTSDPLPALHMNSLIHKPHEKTGGSVSSDDERDAPLSPSGRRSSKNVARSRSSSRGTLGSKNSIDLDGEKRSRRSSQDDRYDSDGTRNFLVAGLPPSKTDDSVKQISKSKMAHRGSAAQEPVNKSLSSGRSRSSSRDLVTAPQIQTRSIPATSEDSEHFAKSAAPRNLPREANRKTSSQAAEIFRKPVTWDDLYPEDKEVASFEPETDDVQTNHESPDKTPTNTLKSSHEPLPVRSGREGSKTPDSGIKSPRSREMSPSSLELEETLKKEPSSTFGFRETSPLSGGSCDSCGAELRSGGRITPRLEYLESLAQLLLSKADEIKATQAELRDMEKLLKDHQNRLPRSTRSSFKRVLEDADNWGTQTTPSLARRTHPQPFVPLKKTISKLAIEEDVGKSSTHDSAAPEQIVARKKKRSLFSFGRKKDKKSKSLKDKNQTL